MSTHARNSRESWKSANLHLFVENMIKRSNSLQYRLCMRYQHTTTIICIDRIYLHCKMYIVECTLYSIYCILYSVYYTIYNLHCTLCVVHCTFTMYSLCCTLSDICRTLHIIYCKHENITKELISESIIQMTHYL